MLLRTWEHLGTSAPSPGAEEEAPGCHAEGTLRPYYEVPRKARARAPRGGSIDSVDQ